MKRSLLALLLIPVLLLAACGPAEPAVPTGATTGASTEATTTEATTTEATAAGPVSPEEGVELIASLDFGCNRYDQWAAASALRFETLAEYAPLAAWANAIHAAAYPRRGHWGEPSLLPLLDDAFFAKNVLLLTVDEGYPIDVEAVEITVDDGAVRILTVQDRSCDTTFIEHHHRQINLWRVDRSLLEGRSLEYRGACGAVPDYWKEDFPPYDTLYAHPLPALSPWDRTDGAAVSGFGEVRLGDAPKGLSGTVLSARVSRAEYLTLLWQSSGLLDRSREYRDLSEHGFEYFGQPLFGETALAALTQLLEIYDLPVPDASAFDGGEVFVFLEIGGPGAAPSIADGQVVTGRPDGDGVWFTFVCVR